MEELIENETPSQRVQIETALETWASWCADKQAPSLPIMSSMVILCIYDTANDNSQVKLSRPGALETNLATRRRLADGLCWMAHHTKQYFLSINKGDADYLVPPQEHLGLQKLTQRNERGVPWEEHSSKVHKYVSYILA